MKKVLLILMCLLFITTSAYADVLLVWDQNSPADNVDFYQVEMDGVIVAPAVIPGTFHSIVDITSGPHVARVRAHNVWGYSDFSLPLSFNAGKPVAAVNLRLIITE